MERGGEGSEACAVSVKDMMGVGSTCLLFIAPVNRHTWTGPPSLSVDTSEIGDI